MTYLLSSSIILAVLTSFYWLILRKETYFTWNRYILLGNMALALLLPILPAPKIFLEAKSQLVSQISEDVLEPLTKPADPYQDKVDASNKQTPLEEVSEEPLLPVSDAPKINFTAWIYGLGISLLFIRLLAQLIGIFSQIRQSKITKGKRYHIAQLETDISPYSFGKYIVLNPNKYDENQFFQILNHEKIHVRQGHTLDLIFAELLIIFQWFNPFAWLHRYLIVQNQEYEVDAAVLAQGENRKDYQYQLLQIAIPNYPLSITTNYNQSLLKKRIAMMNRKKSSLNVIFKYSLLLPLTFLLLVAFKPVQPVAQESAQSDTEVFTEDRVYVLITDRANQQELKDLQDELTELGFILRFNALEYEGSRIKELDVALQDEKGSNSTFQFSGDSFGEFAFFYGGNGFTGSGLSSSFIEKLQSNNFNPKIFRAGLSTNDDIKTFLKDAFNKQEEEWAERQRERLQDPNWKGELLTYSGTYANLSKKKYKDILNKIKEHDGPVSYYVDGLKWDQEEAMKLGWKQIKEVYLKHEVYRKHDANGDLISESPTTMKVYLSRNLNQRLTNKPKSKDRNVFMVITRKTTSKTLKEAERDLSKHGLDLDLKYVTHDFAGNIRDIDIGAKDDRGFQGHIHHSFEDDPDGKIYIYRLANPSNNNGFGMGSGNTKELIRKKGLPQEVKEALKTINSGYFIGTVSSGSKEE